MGQVHTSEATGSSSSRVLKKQNSIKVPINQAEAIVSPSKNSTENSKKKFTRFGTIRRKLARTIRTGKASDYRRHIRDLVLNWSIKELQYLIKEYEWLQLLKELKLDSDRARSESPTLCDDLQKLSKEHHCADITLVYDGKEFPVHQSFLIHRCQFFKSLLKSNNSKSEKVYVDLIKDIDAILFASLLIYIYCGKCSDHNLVDLLPELAKSFGELNNVHTDMLSMLQSDHYDIILVFNNVVSVSDNSSNSSLDTNFQTPCHSAILCSRSSYFRSLLSKQVDKDKDINEPTKIVLCESILPRAYIKTILQCMYTDVLDLSSIIKWKLADDGTGEADRLLTTAELAMELYEVAEFLDFKKLMQECEDVIIENLNVSSLLGVLEWSSYPSGSKFIHRQALNYFCEEFCTLCKANVFLANIPEKYMIEVVKSDFLHASEEFILASVIKWGEWQIVKTNEKPGSSPSNSFPRRSPKRKDINNMALLEMISNLLLHVRLPHILPSNSSVLQFAYQRGLLQRPFPFDMVASEKRPPPIVYWVKEYQHSLYQRPRLFMNYLYEIKLFLHEQLNGDNDEVSRLSSSSNSATLPCKLPDMLPMSSYVSQSIKRRSRKNTSNLLGISLIDIIQLNETIMRDMLHREKELKSSSTALQAINLAPDNTELLHYIQLQVIREFGLPDEVKDEIFRNKPDLIEDSDSSSSSKHSTLNKIHCSTEEIACPSPADIIVDFLDKTLPEDISDTELALSLATPLFEGSLKNKQSGFAGLESPLDLNFSLRDPLMEQDLIADLTDEKSIGYHN